MTARNEIRRLPAAIWSLTAAVNGGWNGAVSGLRTLAPTAHRGILLTGTASGYDAAIAGAYMFRRAGISARASDARLLLAGELPMPDTEDLVIAVSCSDDTSDTQALCWALRNHPCLVTLADSGTPVSEYGAVRLDLNAEKDTVVPITTYSNACAALWIIARLFAGDTDAEITALCDRISAYSYTQEAVSVSGAAVTLRMQEHLEPGDKVVIAFPSDYPGGEHLRRLLRPFTLREDGPGQVLLCTPDALPALDRHTLVLLPDYLPEFRNAVDAAEETSLRAGARTLLLTNRDLASGSGRLSIRLGCRTAEGAILCQPVPVEMLCALWMDSREGFLRN